MLKTHPLYPLIILISLVSLWFPCTACGEEEISENISGETRNNDVEKLEKLEPVEEDKIGLVFDGEYDYVDLGFSPGFDAKDSFTFELWLKLLADIDSSTVLLGPFINQSGAYGLHTHYAGRVSFGVRTDDSARVDFRDCNIDTWYHLAGVYDSKEKEVKFYVNGIVIGSNKLTGESSILSDENFGFNLPATLHGPRANSGHTYCILYEARLWNVARTQHDILSDMYKRLEGSEPGLIGYWPLVEGTGNTAYDLTDNGNHGIIHGAQWQAELTEISAP